MGLRPGQGIALAALLSLWMWGCAPEPAAERMAGTPRHTVRFADVTEAAGLDFVHVSGGPEQRFILEAMGSGVAFFDFDGDGWLDLFAVNGTRTEGAPATGHRLWRSLPAPDGGRSFHDVTEAAGLGQTGWGMGCAVADYDNDGDLDLYVTYWGPNVLYRNDGDGTFTAVEAGVEDRRWGTSAAFGDLDSDGWLDLYVANYLVFDLDNPPAAGEPCSGWKGLPVFCGPHGLDGQADVLYRNEGDGTFADVSAATGIDQPTHLGLGVLFTDYDGDGDQDIYVANDSTPNLLYRNDGDWRLREVGALAGVAYSEDGRPQAGMGTDSGDYDNDGDLDLLVTNFSDDVNTLYENLGNGSFADATYAAGLGGAVRPFLGWSTALADFDLDGWLDLFVANGHLYPQLETRPLGLSYRQRNLLYWNREGVFALAGPSGLEAEQVSRGAAFGDYDNDGDLDLAVNNLNDRLVLLRNDGGNRNDWVGLHLIGAAGRPAEGASVQLRAEGRVLVRQAKRGYGYLSANDGRVLFGLGQLGPVERIEVRWPSGRVQVVEDPPLRRYLVLREGEEGVIAHYSRQLSPPAVEPAPLMERADTIEEVAFNPDWTAEEYYERATALYKEGRYREVVALVRPALRHYPDAVRLYYAAGVALYSGLGRYEEAAEVLERAAAQDTSVVEVAQLLGVTYLHLNQPAKAAATLARAAALAPGDWETHYRLGLARNHLGEVEAAVAAFAQARELAPREPMPYLELARTYQRLGREQAANEALRRFEALQPLKQEIDRYRQAVRVDPAHPGAWSKLGLALAEAGRLAEAQEAFERSLELAPDAETRTNLANVLLRKDEIEAAVAHYTRALAQDAELAEAHYGLGMALYARGEAAAALVSLRRALALRPEFPRAHINTGVLLQEQGRPAEALDHFRRAVELVPDDARALNNLVIALARAGRVDEARKVLEQALAREVNLPLARRTLVRTLLGLAEVQARQGEWSAAAAIQRQAIDLTPVKLREPLLEQLSAYESSAEK